MQAEADRLRFTQPQYVIRSQNIRVTVSTDVLLEQGREYDQIQHQQQAIQIQANEEQKGHADQVEEHAALLLQENEEDHRDDIDEGTP